MSGCNSGAASLKLGAMAQATERPVFATARLAREWKIVTTMIRCYCQGRHGTKTGFCPECQGLVDYAALRLDRCRFGAEKPTCANCPVHCYQRDRREQVKQVMRYAGPRMLWLHPIMCLRHWLDGFRPAPKLH
ncbi:MAG TPA: nitrous oxide-stimulated promoter family protein [Dongiaceae bacterium]|nr:nitrous oxide-stimulated promoter family protein [Dongiaceae bacterium]